MCEANNIVVLDTPLYKYVQREGSCKHTVSEGRVRGNIDSSALTERTGRRWRWHDAGKKVFFRKVRQASIGEAAGLIPQFDKAKRRELWDYFFDRLNPAFGGDGYVPGHVRWLYRLAFRLRSPFIVYWLLHKSYVIACWALKSKLLLSFWKWIR